MNEGNSPEFSKPPQEAQEQSDATKASEKSGETSHNRAQEPWLKKHAGGVALAGVAAMAIGTGAHLMGTEGNPPPHKEPASTSVQNPGEHQSHDKSQKTEHDKPAPGDASYPGQVGTDHGSTKQDSGDWNNYVDNMKPKGGTGDIP
jgi:hypothetical protein